MSAARARQAAANGDSPATRRQLLKDTGRAAGGALLFSLPMMMTQEMWQLGYTMPDVRLLVLVALILPLLMELSRQLGLQHSSDWRQNLLEALYACAVGAAVSAAILVCFGVLDAAMSPRETIGKVALQAVPAAIGALLARSQMGSGAGDRIGDREETYAGELFLMAVGALFLGFNIAPTEETILISFRMTPWHGIATVLLSLAIMHGFVFAVGFKGGSEIEPDTPWWAAFVRFTLPGYAVALTISLAVLWMFGRTDDTSLMEIVMATIVLALPSSVGAAAARLIL